MCHEVSAVIKRMLEGTEESDIDQQRAEQALEEISYQSAALCR